MEGDNGMASIKQSLEHSAAEAKKLAITIPSTVTRNTLRCAEEGDSFARNIYESNGNYAKLASAFTSIANICDKTLKNEAMRLGKKCLQNDSGIGSEVLDSFQCFELHPQLLSLC